jgi:hypothetical protein
MTPTQPIEKIDNSPIPGEATLRRVRFVQEAGVGQEVLLDFMDPAPCKAVAVLTEPEPTGNNPSTGIGDGVDILTATDRPNDRLGWSDDLLKWVAESALPGTAPPIAITIHGAQVIWGSARAAILAAPDRVEPLLLALVDFCYYENELRKLEREIGEGWPLLEMDAPLAYAVAAPDPERFESIGQRMEQTLKRRIRLERIAPHLYQPRAHLAPLANQLIERLREKAHVEDRHEALGSQLEVFERVYEMNSQRISDFNIARQDRTLEWVIIVLLASETFLLLIDVLWTLKV